MKHRRIEHRGLRLNKYLAFEDSEGYCHIVVPNANFKQPKETDALAISRLWAIAIPEVSYFIAFDKEKIPSDNAYRDAWKLGDINEPIKIDFDKALEIHRERIKKAAKLKIAQLWIEMEDAIRARNLPLQVSIRKTSFILETIHEMNLTHCKTLNELKSSVPKELHNVWNFYKL